MPSIDWPTALQRDLWAEPYRPDERVAIAEMPLHSAERAYGVLLNHDSLAAAAVARYAMRNPAPDGVGDWWPRTSKERSRVRREPREWITSTPLARALKGRIDYVGDVDLTYELNDSNGYCVDMTVRDLLTYLRNQPLDAKVVVFSDAEGNTVHPVHRVTIDTFFAAGPRNFDNELVGNGQGGVRCVALWPAD
ncbi:hypothetical protein [Planomonospora sp. ID82291]|uniref:hypothetical protein n=1 Tax=Planomonospora sp. ID82291 TaxID=2738136 RepID=UPI0018C3FAA2|nr:hypothetical protein [Planomonospora sp. ID82291]MBG0818260.1 hypothetical protein [Planomonospora sp. ID82291]